MNYLKRLPLVPTIVVVAAVVTMIALGFWQLGRAEEKAGLLQRYAVADEQSETVAWPRNDEQLTKRLYRTSSIECAKVTELTAVAGTNEKGSKGWAQIAECVLPDGDNARVALGWTRDPQGPIAAVDTIQRPESFGFQHMTDGDEPPRSESRNGGDPGTLLVEVNRTQTKEQRLVDEARVKGYEGDPCTSCQQFTLVRNGTCLSSNNSLNSSER